MIFSLISKQLMSYLHIAQKNSIAKQVAQILSDGNKRTGSTLSKFNPVYLFQMQGENHTFSSVRGHIFEYQLPPQCKSWYAFDNRKILTRQVPMIRKAGQGMDDLLRNLQSLARGKKQLILWLDCDRQGQAIAFQVLQVIKRINPSILIKRARFAAVTRQDIIRAYQNLILPNQLEADAVNYRIEIDFRMGCAFTRYQTITFQKKFKFKEHSVLSYGPCQMPTLGFVVDRYLEIKNFKPQKYWVVQAKIILDQKTHVDLKCQRGNVKDQAQANIIFASLFQDSTEGNGIVKGKVLQRNKNQKKKYRPYPLTTVKFQKLATDKLRITSAQAMKIAQKLYMNGFISYPRTETNSFPATMHVPQLVKRLQNCSTYSGYINSLLENGKYMKPKIGNQNDQAHAPIHPVKPAQKVSLTPQQWKVYDLITRHFLACCSKDAVGIQSQIVAQIGNQYFRASHLAIKQKNYLQIYPFQKWTQSQFPGEIPQIFQAALDLRESKTQPPGYLTQSQLITQMQKNQIGTDSTIHQHIQTIQDRKYAIKSSNTFKPTNLGASLIVTYKQLGVRLEDCRIRRIIQERMDKIAAGNLTKEDATRQTLSQVTPIFQDLKRMEERWLKQMEQALHQHQNLKQIQMSTDIFNRNNENNRGNNQNSQNNSQQNLQNPSTDSNLSIICYGCRKPGHILPNCPEKNSQRGQIKRQVITREREVRDIPPQRQRNIQRQDQSKPVQKKGFFCYHCKQPGHGANQCPNKNKKKQYDGQKVQTKKFTCFLCGEEGHFAPDCPKKKKMKQSDNQNTHFTAPVCYICKKQGHFANKCPQKQRPYMAQQKTNQKKQRKKNCCPYCGVERHAKGSSCPGKQKNKKNVSSDDGQY